MARFPTFPDGSPAFGTTQFTNYVIEKMKYSFGVAVEQEQVVDDNYHFTNHYDIMNQRLILSMDKIVHKTKESIRCEKSNIKGIDTEYIGELPMRLRDHLLILIGLRRFARMVCINRNTHIHVENKITVIEKHCPHLNVPDNNEHFNFLVSRPT